MKIGINAWCFPNDYTIADGMKLAKAAGLDSIELNITEADRVPGPLADSAGRPTALTLDTTDAQLAQIAAMAQAAGIEISSVSTNLHWSYPLTANDPAVREKGREIVRRMLRAASAFHTDAVLVVPGLVDETVSYRTAYERAQEALNSLKGEAESAGVTIGVENVWNKLLLSPLEMARFIDEIGSRRVGAYFDVGNVLQYSYPEYWIEVLGSRIARVHVKDFNTKIGNIDGFVNLLEGEVNWNRVMKALRTAGYDGYLTAELTPYHTYPARIAADVAGRLGAIVRGQAE